jgi:hypothetical protein
MCASAAAASSRDHLPWTASQDPFFDRVARVLDFLGERLTHVSLQSPQPFGRQYGDVAPPVLSELERSVEEYVSGIPAALPKEPHLLRLPRGPICCAVDMDTPDDQRQIRTLDS